MKNYKSFFTFLFIIFSLTAYTCANAEFSFFYKRIKGNGKIVTVQRQVSQFNAIRNQGPINLEISTGKKQAVSITANSNIVPVIETKVKNDTLVISIKKDTSLSSEHNIIVHIKTNKLAALTNEGTGKIHITGPLKLNKIKIRGTGNIIATQLDANDLSVSSHGTGNIQLSGKINLKSLQQSGTGNIRISGITSKFISIINRGEGNTYLSGQANDIKINAKGVGNINANALKVKNASISIHGIGSATIDASDNLIAKIWGVGNIIYTGQPKHITQQIHGIGRVSQATS